MEHVLTQKGAAVIGWLGLGFERVKVNCWGCCQVHHQRHLAAAVVYRALVAKLVTYCQIIIGYKRCCEVAEAFYANI